MNLRFIQNDPLNLLCKWVGKQSFVAFPTHSFDINRPSLKPNVILRDNLLNILELILDDTHQLLFVQAGPLFDRILGNFDPDCVLRADNIR